MFRPILTESDLPEELATHETFQLDFKATASSTAEDSFEKAKDVAGFANNLGGVVLVGAQEDRLNKRLGRYAALTEREAADLATAYDEAVRDRCFPKPLTNIARIAFTTRGSGFVVAVNVWPFPGQPVGVKGLQDARCFAFPVRVGTNTTYLTPDQLAMFMLPDVRRVAVLLSSIPEDQRGSILLQPAIAPGKGLQPLEVQLELRSDELVMKNTVRFKTANDIPFSLPADSILHVWEGSPQWAIVARISLEGNRESGPIRVVLRS